MVTLTSSGVSGAGTTVTLGTFPNGQDPFGNTGSGTITGEVTIDGELVTVTESFQWSSNTNNVLTLTSALGNTFSNASVIATNFNELNGWRQANSFNTIPNVDQFGLLSIDGVTANENLGIGIDNSTGETILIPRYKEFRILALSLQEQEEVELTCMEYDVTVYDNEPFRRS